MVTHLEVFINPFNSIDYYYNLNVHNIDGSIVIYKYSCSLDDIKRYYEGFLLPEVSICKREFIFDKILRY